MTRTLVWTGIEAVRSEVAHVIVDRGRLCASGTQIGIEPRPYELRYEVGGDRLAVELVGGASRELDLGRGDHFDLGFSPLFNSFPVLADGLHRGGAPHDYVMRWVDVPSLDVSLSEQRYEPVRAGVVRFRSGSFTADIEFDEEGLVVCYPGLAVRAG